MQLIALALAFAATLSGCEQRGGLRVDEPLPPDAPPGTTSGGDADSAMLSGLLDESEGGIGESGNAEGNAEASGSEGGDGGSVRTLVPDGARWRIADVAPEDWRSAAFDDSAWAERTAPLGNGYEVASTWQPTTTTTYVRHAFELDDPAAIEALALRIRRDDGAIIHLNGVEVARSNVEGGAIAAATLADDEVEGADGYTYFHAAPSTTPLVAGTNVLAVEIHQRTATDLVFDARLRAIAAPTEVTAVTLQLRTVSYGGEYAPRNVGAVWVETAAGDYVRTLGLWADERREHLVGWSAAGGPLASDAITSATASSHGSRVLEWARDDASGAAVSHGAYVLRVELAEANANEGAGTGPTLAIPFALGEGPTVIRPEPTTYFRDLLLLVP